MPSRKIQTILILATTLQGCGQNLSTAEPAKSGAGGAAPRPAMTIVAAQDPALRATLERCEPLVYSARAPAELDRPDHVRAASAIAARRSPDGTVAAIALRAGAGGRRGFEERLGNKGDKLDLEAAIVVGGAHGLRLVAFGSGSTLRRDRIAVVDLAVEGGTNPWVV